MNKHGFTLIELLATLVIIAIIMGIVLPTASKMSRDNQDKIYEEYKKVMVEYADISPLKGQSVIGLSQLGDLEKIKRDCIGYVQLDSHNIYQAYIQCPADGSSYHMTGFNSSLAS